MRKHKMPSMQEGSVNVTPLIDVVMCLIIFFILVAKIGVSTGIDDKIDAPMTYLGVHITDLGNTLALNLYDKPGAAGLDEPQVLVDLKGERQKELKLQDTVNGKKVHPLKDTLQQLKKERGDKFKVIINAAKGMRYAQLQLVLQACAEAGVMNVNFVTKTEKTVVSTPS
jgi:biopolymer transport protein ExbD